MPTPPRHFQRAAGLFVVVVDVVVETFAVDCCCCVEWHLIGRCNGFSLNGIGRTRPGDS